MKLLEQGTLAVPSAQLPTLCPLSSYYSLPRALMCGSPRDNREQTLRPKFSISGVFLALLIETSFTTPHYYEVWAIEIFLWQDPFKAGFKKTRGSQHRKLFFNIFGNDKPTPKHPLGEISSREELFIYLAAEHVQIMFIIKFMPKPKGLCHLLVTCQKCKLNVTRKGLASNVKNSRTANHQLRWWTLSLKLHYPFQVNSRGIEV